tara:strand:+ start:232 stop:1695 length:1464 start_codon:yes stop_codon:yes gene_type:complete
MATNYGTGTALAFSDASQRQVLELGSKIHYYNPNVTPIFSLFGMKSMMTPVPIFEWMEDEYMIKKSVKKALVTATAGDIAATADIGDTTTGAINGHNTIIRFDKQADVELFEVGGLYSHATTGDGSLQAGVTHVIAVAIGKGVNSANASDRMVQFIGCHVKSGDATVYQVEQCADGADLFGVHADEVATFTHVGTAGQYDSGVYKGSNGLFQAEAAFVDDKEFKLEGGAGTYAEGAAVGAETSKKVRRLKNCTQIFREPYTITNTAKASKHYGGSEMSRLQARKLAKIKADIEWAILTNGAISLDASSENPKRTFQGLGLGSSAGSVVSLNGYDNTNLQWDFDGTNPLTLLDGVCEYIFSDMVSGSMKKTVFASNKWMVRLAAATRSQDTGFYDTGEKTQSGLRVRSYMGPVGQLDFVPHPFLKGAYEDYAIAVDPANFSIRPLAGRNMQLRKDIVKDGRDGQTDEWLMETGVEIRNEQTHAILKLV